MDREEIFRKIGRQDLLNEAFEPYMFLSLFHPNFCGCDNIAWMDDIEKYINNEYNPDDLKDNVTRLENVFPDKYDANVEQLRLYCQEMLRAITNYQHLRYPNDFIPY